MPTRLILVRHAAVQIDKSVNSHDWQLTEDGRSATHLLAPKLHAYQPRHIYNSEEPKARATGTALADVLHLATQAVGGLQEHDRRGVPFFESKSEFETAVSQLFTHPHELLFGQETGQQARQRFSQAITNLCQRHPNETIIITTHGTVLTLFVTHFNPQLDATTFWRSLEMPEAIILTRPQFALQERLTANS